MRKIVKILKKTCIESNGAGFQLACNQALQKLKIGTVIGLESFSRISDNAWIVPINCGDLLIIIENKAGNAIHTLDVKKQEENITNTYSLLKRNNYIKQICGLWIWIINGESVTDPRKQRIHGGKRSGDDLLEKIKKIYRYLKKRYSEETFKIKISVFSLNNFILYANYLYNKLKDKEEKSIISKSDLKYFWDWCNLFTEPEDIYGIDDERISDTLSNHL
ncbi:MAG: hypothetical protein ACTSP3_02585 [Candidatus Heimdallarchaeaceae archaeon]